MVEAGRHPEPSVIEGPTLEWADGRGRATVGVPAEPVAGERVGRAKSSVRIHVTFAKPLSGPMVIGYGSHYGLGLFLPARPISDRREVGC